LTYKHVKASWYTRNDSRQIYVRSGWEANWAAYLDWLLSLGEIKGWEYEPEEFEFTEIKRGTRFYKPDFRVVNGDGSVEYHEIKGRWTQKARTQVSRFRKYYPEHKLIVVDREAYKAVVKRKNLIPKWGG